MGIEKVITIPRLGGKGLDIYHATANKGVYIHEFIDTLGKSVFNVGKVVGDRNFTPYETVRLGRVTASQVMSYDTMKEALKATDSVSKNALRLMESGNNKELFNKISTLWSSVGSIYAPLLGKVGSVTAAGAGGWMAGRQLGKTPLLTDPSTTYDQFYTNAMQSIMEKKQK